MQTVAVTGMKNPPNHGSRLFRHARNLAVLIFVRGAGTFLSFLITILIVDRFGTSATADGLLAVRRLMMRLGESGRLLIVNALLPLFATSLTGSDPGRFRNTVLMRFYQAGAVGLLLSTLISVFSADIVQLIASGFDPQRQEIATNALYVFAFLLTPMLAVGVLTAAANARGIFGFPDAAQMVPRLFALTVLALLPPGASAVALPWVYVFGGSIGLVGILLWLARSLRPPDDVAINKGDANTGSGMGGVSDRTGARFWALLFTVIGAQIGLWIQLHFAAHAGAGAMTYLECSQAVMVVLPSVFLNSVFSIAYAESAHRVQGSGRGISAEQLARLIEIGLYFMLPVILIPTIFSDQVAHLLFVRGSFSESDAAQVAMMIVAFSVAAVIAVVQNGLNIVLLVEPGIPMVRLSVMQMLIQIGGNFILLLVFMPLLGILALPLALAGTGFAVLVARFVATRAWRPTIRLLLLGRRFWSILLAAAVFSAFGLWLHGLVPEPSMTSTLNAVSMLALFGVVGTLLYLCTGLALGLWRLDMMKRARKRK